MMQFVPHSTPVNTGGIEVVAGCMFSGKTEELIRRLRRAQIAKLNVTVFKPKIDDRYSKKEHLISKFPHTIPYSIIDPRIFDLAVSFWESPGDIILTGYKRLEGVWFESVAV